MKKPVPHIIVGLLFFIVFSEILPAVESYTSPATVPPSVRREGLIRSPAQVDGSGNLLITGNVRGGNYFRGVVPYSAPTDFGVALPSSSLDSFLRDSAGSEDFGRYTAGYKPYYSSTQTVTSTMPGVSAVGGASTTNIGAYSIQSYLSGTLPTRRDAMLDPASALSLARLRPMSMTPAEMQKLIFSEAAKYSPARLTDQQYHPWTEQSKSDISQEGDKTVELNKTLTSLDYSLLPSPAGKPDSNLLAAQEEPPGEKKVRLPFDVPEELDLNKQLDVYDSMKHQLDILQKKLELAMAEQQTEEAHLGEESADGETLPSGESRSQAAGSVAGGGGEKPAEEQTQQPSHAEKLAEIDLSVARTKAILGPYETFASFSEDKFNQNMRAGELYLKQGRYYRAADAYTLASLYKPDDPLAYAGKSHALFASGEYMSSALFLSRCLQIFPEYARFKIDIVAMVGSRDLLESRVADVEEWLKRSGAPELQFLLAYVYYQMDRLQPSKDAIETAYKMMPDVPAVLVLKKAIEDSPETDKNSSSQRITDDAEPKLGW
jgi:tetratricopeptide (TPR) repeat protein